MLTFSNRQAIIENITKTLSKTNDYYIICTNAKKTTTTADNPISFPAYSSKILQLYFMLQKIHDMPMHLALFSLYIII